MARYQSVLRRFLAGASVFAAGAFVWSYLAAPTAYSGMIGDKRIRVEKSRTRTVIDVSDDTGFTITGIDDHSNGPGWDYLGASRPDGTTIKLSNYFQAHYPPAKVDSLTRAAVELLDAARSSAR